MTWRSFFGFPEKGADLGAQYAPASTGIASPFAPYPSHFNTIVWSDILGDDPDFPVGRADAMSVPAVARARMLLAGSVAQIPLVAFSGGKRKVDQPRWIDRNDTPMSPFHRMLWTADDLLFYGWSLWWCQRDAAGVVVSCGRIPYDRWEFDNEGNIKVDDSLVSSDQVILIPGVDEGLLNRSQGAIRHAMKLRKAAEQAAENPVPALELHQTNDAPMTTEEINALVTAWANARKGINGGVAFTNSAIEVIEHGSASEQLLIEGRNAAAVDIARACGLPASMLDATGPSASLTYETTEGRTRELIDFGIAPFMQAISSRLSLDDVTPRGTTVSFDVNAYVGPSSTSWADHTQDAGGSGATPSPGSSVPNTEQEG